VIERLESQIAGLKNLARDYEAEWKARRMAVHVLSNALDELRDADPVPDCKRCDEAVNRDVGHIAEKLGCEATVEAVEAVIEGFIAAFEGDAPELTRDAVETIKAFRLRSVALRELATRFNVDDNLSPEEIVAAIVREAETLTMPTDANVRWPGLVAQPEMPTREERTGHGFIEGPGGVIESEGDSGDAMAARELVADVVRDGDIGAARRALDTGWRRGTDESES